MRIYLAGENGKLKILSALIGGGAETLERYINADVSGRNGSMEIPHTDVYKWRDP